MRAARPSLLSGHVAQSCTRQHVAWYSPVWARVLGPGPAQSIVGPVLEGRDVTHVLLRREGQRSSRPALLREGQVQRHLARMLGYWSRTPGRSVPLGPSNRCLS